MNILSATNAFKGSPRNVIHLNDAIAEELRNGGHTVETFPIADGGDGTLTAFQANLGNARVVMESTILDPLGRSIDAEWLYIPKNSGIVSEDTALIELARASGLALLKTEERNPLVANTRGTGQLIVDAICHDCKKIELSVGGSGTVDAGMGLMVALGVKFYDEEGRELLPNGANLEKIRSIDISIAEGWLKGRKIEFLSDVKTPLRNPDPHGNNVMLYTTQKFSNPNGNNNVGKEILNRGMDNIARIVDGIAGRPASTEKSTGAAGGAPYMPIALLRASVVSGIDRMAKMFNLEDRVERADIVITGEGFLDEQTLEGKGPAKLIELGRKHNKKVVVVCGGADDNITWKNHGVDLVIKINPPDTDLQTSIANTEPFLREAIRANMAKIEAL